MSVGEQMSATFEEFQDKFRVSELTIATTDHWTWSVRPVHSTLGAGILSLNRFCTSFSEINENEGADLARITRVIESKLAGFSDPDKMNYVMLMMVDDHLHFHVLPRYASPRDFSGMVWEDSGWPGPPGMADYSDRQTSPVLIEIRDALRSSG